MSSESVILEKDGSICNLIMNRPNVMNALDANMVECFKSALEKIEKDNTIRVIILSGAGGNFSSGADLNLLANADYAPETLNMLRVLRKIMLQLRNLDQPIVTKVRGVAYGFGANLALLGDFVVASNNARFCEVFVNINAMIDGGGSYYLPRLVGLAKAKELALLGEEFSGKEAKEIGLIYKSVDENELDEAALDVAKKLSKKEPVALSLIKEALDNSLNMSFSEALEWEFAHQAIMIQSKEHKLLLKKLLKR